MALSNEDLQAIASLLEPIQNDMEYMKTDMQIMKADMQGTKADIQKMNNRLEILEIKQNKTNDRLEELQLSTKLFELGINKKLSRLQDGMDTIEEIMKINELIPG